MRSQQLPTCLRNVYSNERLWEHAKAVGLDHTRQGAVLHVLQDDVQVAARLEGPHVFDDVLVVERLQQLNLTHDTSQVLLGSTSKPYLLDGDDITGGGVHALVHLAIRTPVFAGMAAFPELSLTE
jgi:hypothetical protein